MSKEVSTTEQQQAQPEAPQQEESAPPAEANTSDNEHMIPKSRLDQALQAKKDLEARLLAFQEADNKRKEAEMSEVEKALAQADKERANALKAQEQLSALQAQIVASKRETAFKSAIRQAGGSSEDDLFILVQAKMQDELLSAFDDDATVNAKQMEALVKQVQSSYGNYFASAGAGNPSVSGGTAPTSFTEVEQKTKDEIESRFGQL